MGETRTLVERLRAYGSRGDAFMGQYVLCSEAADTIERQEQEIERLRQIVEAYEEDRDPYEGGEP